MEQEWAAEATWSVPVQDRLEVAPQVLVDDFTWRLNKAGKATPPSPPAHLSRETVAVMVPQQATAFEAMTNGVYMVFVKRGSSWVQAYSPRRRQRGAAALS